MSDRQTPRVLERSRDPGAAHRVRVAETASGSAPRFFDERCIGMGLAALAAVVVFGWRHGVDWTRVWGIAGTCGVLAAVCSIPLFWQVEQGWRRWISPASCVSVGFLLYYGVGNVPCGLWAYEKMYVSNPGSYAYYPWACLFTAACLLVFLQGYRSALAVRRVLRPQLAWSIPHLASASWTYLVALVLVTYATRQALLPPVLVTTATEFIPTGFLLLTIMGFSVRGRPPRGGFGPHPLFFLISILVPAFFFILSNRRYYALCMVGLVLILSLCFGTRWRLRHYAAAMLAVIAIYVFQTHGIRGASESPEELRLRSSISHNLQAIPANLAKVFSRAPETGESEIGVFERDASYRMAGLEMISGMFASRAEGRGQFLWGRCAVVSVLKMIPRVVWPWKPEFASYAGSVWSSESMTIDAFELTDNDQLSTPVAIFYADGGIIFAAVAMWALGRMSGWLTVTLLRGRELTPRSLLLFLPLSFSLLIFFEREGLEWVLHPLRNLVLIWLVVKVLDSNLANLALPRRRSFPAKEGPRSANGPRQDPAPVMAARGRLSVE